MSHYFLNDENLKSNIREFQVEFAKTKFKFKTDNGVFSKGELDYGTFLLLDTVLKQDVKGQILDLGCGYGVIGIIVEKLKKCMVTMVDINSRAIDLSKINIKENNSQNIKVICSDGFTNISNKFNYIITNPPIRIGKKKLYELIKEAKKYLFNDGLIYLVIRKEQGAKSFIKDMNELYEVQILNKSKGFYIISLKGC